MNAASKVSTSVAHWGVGRSGHRRPDEMVARFDRRRQDQVRLYQLIICSLLMKAKPQEVKLTHRP